MKFSPSHVEDLEVEKCVGPSSTEITIRMIRPTQKNENLSNSYYMWPNVHMHELSVYDG